MFLPFLLVRLMDRELGQCHTIPSISSRDALNDIIALPSISVVFFVDDISSYNFSNYAIFKFNKTLKFVVCSDGVVANSFGVEIPSIVAFRKGKIIKRYSSSSSEIIFAKWCNGLTESKKAIKRLDNSEELRKILEKKKNVLLGIDNLNPPKEYNNDIRFYYVPSILFKVLNISVKSGIYVYKGIERQLIRSSQNYHSYLRTFVVDPEKTNLTERKYFGAMFMTSYNGKENEKEMNLIHQLSNEFQNDFYFSPLIGNVAGLYSLIFNVSNLERPFFVVGDTSDLTNKRWVINNKELINFNYIKNYLNKIRNNEIKPNHVSEDININDEFQIVYSNYYEKIKKNSLVLFLQTNDEVTDYCRLSIQYAKDELKSINFYTFNVSKNDIPMNINYKDYPFYIFYKDDKTPIYLKGEEDFEKLIKFIANESNDEIKIEFDIKDIQIKIKSKIEERSAKERFEKSMVDEL